MIKFLKKTSFIYMADTPWASNPSDKLYLTSGQFTAVIKDSKDVSGIDADVSDITYDGVNSPWVGFAAKKLYLQSGQFTSTLKTSQTVNVVDTFPYGISWDKENTPWIGSQAKKLYLQSGHFTSTLKTSQAIGGVETGPSGISFDGTNTPWTGSADDKLYLTSGQFTAVLKDSQAVGGVDLQPYGISWDGTNTPWCGNEASKLYLQSGQYTATLKTSQAVGAGPSGICTNDVISRVGAIAQHVIDPLTISDSIDTTIVRAPLPTQHIVDDLIISDGVLGYIDYIPVVDSLTITDTIDVFVNVIDIIDYLAITDTVYYPIIHDESVIDAVTVSDSISVDYNVYEIVDDLIILQYVDLDTEGYLERERVASNELTISDSVDIEKDYAFKITDTLIITDNFDTIAPKHIVVEDTLTIVDTPGGVFQYNITVEDEFDILYIDTENLIIYRIMDKVERHYTANRVPWNFLTIQQIVQVSHEKTGAIERSIIDTLTITDEATVARSLEDSLTISDLVSVTQGALAKNDFTITDEVAVTKEVNEGLLDNLILKLTVEYTHVKTHTHHEYAPFIGTTTDPDAPTPPSLTEPSITTYTNVQLTYPLVAPSLTLILDGPELGNQDQLNYTRINRETRGGTLIIFADPDWPKREQFNLQFIGLSEAESQEILDFLRLTLGKQIKLRDWEGNERTVITTTPDNPIVREGYCKNTVSLNFESVL